jgi:predicted transposase YbfD/YdcC
VKRDYPYFQADETMKGKRLYGEVRTSSVCLVGNNQATYLDCVPVPAETNEMGMFPEVLNRIQANWANTWKIELLSMDAGMTSLDNATRVDQANLGYLMAVKDNQPTLIAELHKRLDTGSCEYEHSEEYRGKLVTIRAWRTKDIAGWHDWTHLRQGIRIQRETKDHQGSVEKIEDRYFVTNLLWNRLSTKEWAQQIRSHWLVENAAHRTLDVALNEGSSPWTQHPNGMQAMALLRRIALNLLNLLRSLYLRSQENRATPWKLLLQGFHDLLRGATMDDLVRPRKQAKRAAT